MVVSTKAHSATTSSQGGAHTTSFTKLPAEIRNNIYKYLYYSTDTINLYFYQDTTTNVTKSVVPFASSASLASSFFLACRQVNSEASYVFYSSNSFLLNRNTQFASFSKPCFVGALLKFFDVVGSQATLVRNVVFDTFVFCNGACRHTCTGSEASRFDPTAGVIDVTALLHYAWKRNLDFRISLNHNTGGEQDGLLCRAQDPSLVRAGAVVAIVQSLLNGQLGVKMHSANVDRVGVKRDGSGGLIIWSSILRAMHGAHSPCYFPHTETTFSVREEGTRLEFSPQAARDRSRIPD